MTDRLDIRVGLIVALLIILAGLFVFAGTIDPAPSDRDYPGGVELLEGTSQYLGDRVVVSGTVTAVDPVTIEAEPVAGETLVFAVSNTARTPAIGDQIIVYGTLRAENRIHAIEQVHREPWERQYMYVVSFVGGLWVLARLITGWRFDPGTWSFVPRPQSLWSRGER